MSDNLNGSDAGALGKVPDDWAESCLEGELQAKSEQAVFEICCPMMMDQSNQYHC